MRAKITHKKISSYFFFKAGGSSFSLNVLLGGLFSIYAAFFPADKNSTGTSYWPRPTLLTSGEAIVSVHGKPDRSYCSLLAV
jgi:hypothetical protein